MKEIWKDIKGFEGLYQISNTGRVKSFRKSKKYGEPNEYILKNYIANNGYMQVFLYSAKAKKKFSVHRLVAETFIPNPNHLPQVNHKDENTLNNCVENLEWCTAAYNNKYGTARIRGAITHGSPIRQYLPTGELLAIYACSSVASELTGIPVNVIKKCASGKSKTGNNFIWKYEQQKHDLHHCHI